MSRGLMDKLTNRDIIREQKFNIEYMTKELKDKNELVALQADAIDEFREQVMKQSEEISALWDSVNAKTRTKPVEKDEPEKN